MTSGEIKAHLNAARRDIVRAEQLRDRFAREVLLATGRAEAFEQLLAAIEKANVPAAPEVQGTLYPPMGEPATINGAAPAA
jgi:hypothetical protein